MKKHISSLFFTSILSFACGSLPAALLIENSETTPLIFTYAEGTRWFHVVPADQTAASGVGDPEIKGSEIVLSWSENAQMRIRGEHILKNVVQFPDDFAKDEFSSGKGLLGLLGAAGISNMGDVDRRNADQVCAKSSHLVCTVIQPFKLTFGQEQKDRAMIMQGLGFLEDSTPYFFSRLPWPGTINLGYAGANMGEGDRQDNFWANESLGLPKPSVLQNVVGEGDLTHYLSLSGTSMAPDAVQMRQFEIQPGQSFCFDLAESAWVDQGGASEQKSAYAPPPAYSFRKLSSASEEDSGDWAPGSQGEGQEAFVHVGVVSDSEDSDSSEDGTATPIQSDTEKEAGETQDSFEMVSDESQSQK